MEIDACENVKSERDFQKVIVELIRNLLDGRNADYILLERFGLDISVILRNRKFFEFVFFELKYFCGYRPGGVGFGNGSGEGSQVDILIQDESRMRIFDSSIRWILFDSTKKTCDPRFAFFSCEEAKKAAMGEVSYGKQNNINLNKLRTQFITWPLLVDRITNFIFLASENGEIK